MKKHIFLIAVFLMILTGCEKILEVEPVEFVSGEEAIKNKTDLERAIIGCYDGLQQVGCYGRHLPVIGDLVADNLIWTGTSQEYGQFENNNLLADNLIVESIWNAHYDLINRVNYALYKLPDISDISQEETNDYMGQLYFLRALCHFNLVRLYGPIPVKTSPNLNLTDNLFPSRDPVDVVYDQIISDLTAAEGKIVNTAAGYASNGAVAALLSMVYLNMQDYENAKAKANEVISEYGYSLSPKYGDIFTQTLTPESIFTVLFNPQDNNRLAEYHFPTTLNGRNEVSPSESILEAYAGDTLRKNASVAGNPAYCIKYPDLATGANNVHVIRLAEIYLIRAECEARLNGSVSAIQYDINQLRQRAELDDITNTDYDELLLAIEAERRVELAFEGKRWFELVRTGRAIEVIETLDNPDYLLFPVPLAEIQSNPNMTQNNGY